MIVGTLIGILVLQDSGRPMAGHSMVYSHRDHAVLLLDGDTSGPKPILKLVERGWEAIPGSELPARSLAAVAADENGNVLVHGGAVGTTNSDGSIDFKVTAESWSWDGKKWSLVSTTGPAARDHHVMAFDSLRGVAVVYGGSAGNDVLGDLWEFKEDRWTARR